MLLVISTDAHAGSLGLVSVRLLFSLLVSRINPTCIFVFAIVFFFFGLLLHAIRCPDYEEHRELIESFLTLVCLFLLNIFAHLRLFARILLTEIRDRKK